MMNLGSPGAEFSHNYSQNAIHYLPQYTQHLFAVVFETGFVYAALPDLELSM